MSLNVMSKRRIYPQADRLDYFLGSAVREIAKIVFVLIIVVTVIWLASLFQN